MYSNVPFPHVLIKVSLTNTIYFFYQMDSPCDSFIFRYEMCSQLYYTVSPGGLSHKQCRSKMITIVKNVNNSANNTCICVLC